MKIDTIIFDFGGVLVDWNPKYVYRQLFEKPEDMHWFLENICTDEWNLEQDRGRPLAEGTAILVGKFPEYEALIRAFYGRWEEMLGGDIGGSVEILFELKRQYPVYGLTNWSAETFPVALERFDFFKVFDGIVVSGTEKLVKPDSAIFRLILDRYRLKAENALFIDDNIKNIQAAGEMGFHTIHFESPEKLRAQLAQMKII
jgi:2-haloacid dehalogenase